MPDPTIDLDGGMRRSAQAEPNLRQVETAELGPAAPLAGQSQAIPRPPVPSVIYENAHLMAVQKPAGWLSVPSRLGAQDARPCVGIFMQEQLGARLWPVHRLDEEVSGLLLFARSAGAHRLLCSGFEAHLIEKTYQALCEGRIPEDLALGETRLITSTLLRGKRRAYVHPAGKRAVTQVKLLSVLDDILRFELKPQTGRPHQLRVELARRGCPILGDSLYGARRAFSEGGIALSAVALGFARFSEREALGLPLTLSAPTLLFDAGVAVAAC